MFVTALYAFETDFRVCIRQQYDVICKKNTWRNLNRKIVSVKSNLDASVFIVQFSVK